MTRIETKQDVRVDTGPLKLNSDWCGVFLRGDHADEYIAAIKAYRDVLRGKELIPEMFRESSARALDRMLSKLEGYQE